MSAITEQEKTKIERILETISDDAADSANIRVGKLLIVSVSIAEDKGSRIALHAWTETDLIRWHDAVVKKRYDLERQNGKEPAWVEAFDAVDWPKSRHDVEGK